MTPGLEWQPLCPIGGDRVGRHPQGSDRRTEVECEFEPIKIRNLVVAAGTEYFERV